MLTSKPRPMTAQRLRNQLLALIVLAAGIGGASWWLFRVARTTREAPAGTAGLRDTALPDAGAGPALPGETPIRLTPGLEAQVLEDTPAHRAVREPEVHAHLLAETANRSFGYLRHLGFAPASRAALSADPRAFRARPLEVRGELAELREEPLERKIAGFETVHRGVLRTREGDVFQFHMLEPPEDGVAPGGTVRLWGVFYKDSLLLDERSPEQSDDHVPFLIGKVLRPSVHPEAVPRIDLERMGRVQDLDVEDARAIEPDAYFHAAAFLKQHPGPVPDAVPADAQVLQLLQDPEASTRWRGRAIRTWGRVVDLFPYPWQVENVAGIDRVHRALIRTADSVNLFVDLVEKPPVRAGDRVRVEAVFVKRWVYETRSGDLRRTPLLVGRTLEPLPPSESPATGPLPIAIVAGAVLFAAALGLVVLTERRAERRFRERFRSGGVRNEGRVRA